MQVKRELPLASHRRDRADVIEVRVREPDRLERDAGRAHHLDDALAFVAGIDEHGATASPRRRGDSSSPRTAPTVSDVIFIPRTASCPRIGDDAAFCRALRYFSTAIAAVVASPTAVVTCRVSCDRTSPAAKSPGMDVCMIASVSR